MSVVSLHSRRGFVVLFVLCVGYFFGPLVFNVDGSFLGFNSGPFFVFNGVTFVDFWRRFSLLLFVLVLFLWEGVRDG